MDEIDVAFVYVVIFLGFHSTKKVYFRLQVTALLQKERKKEIPVHTRATQAQQQISCFTVLSPSTAVWSPRSKPNTVNVQTQQEEGKKHPYGTPMT